MDSQLILRTEPKTEKELECGPVPSLTAAHVQQFWPRQCLRRIGWKPTPVESNTKSQAVFMPKLRCFERLPTPPHAPREQPMWLMGGAGDPTMFGVHVVG